MEQIRYACGRRGELAQDIRWRAGQLPALREAGGTAELRQIAQQIQKLASALHEAALLLEELDLPRVPAYTAQLDVYKRQQRNRAREKQQQLMKQNQAANGDRASDISDEEKDG